MTVLGKFIDLSGKVFGRLTIRCMSHKNSNGQSMWLAVCECGNERIVNVGALNSGHTTSCGCAKADAARERNERNNPDVIGKKFGLLTVVSRAENSNAAKRRFNCVCDCGGSSVSVYSALVNGHVLSCGCLQKDSISKTGKLRLDDLTGKRFSRLLVLGRCIDDSTTGKPKWDCKCDCGSLASVNAVDLRSGATKSCGCYLRESSSARLFKHGQSRTKEYIKEKLKRKYARDTLIPIRLLRRRVRDLINKSITFQGFRKNQKAAKILGCSYDQFRAHIEAQFTKGMSWEKMGEIHLDHIIPISSAKTEEDVYRLNHYSNFRPLWGVENLRKGAKMQFLL